MGSEGVMNVVAVVVTYNRLALLQKNIDCLRANDAVNKILVVDNGSNDGTQEWLDAQHDLCVIHQENVGGSGGFYTGMQQAYEMGAEWIWCMDDDVFPRPDCMKQLLCVQAQYSDALLLAPRRWMAGEVYSNDIIGFNFTRAFKSFYVQKHVTRNVTEPTYIDSTAFEGLCVHRSVVETVGLPNKNLFIFCDDTDYCLRAYLAGYKLLYVPTAAMDKHQFFVTDTRLERQRKKLWKRYYQIRNSTYMSHHYGRTWMVRNVRGWIGMMGYVFTFLFTMPSLWNAIPDFFSAYCDGVNEKLGKR